ncbi:MAG TPA: hypothetical protein VMQ52_02185 [Candidatus Saccharimonadales bacterium]|jgi:hypothetical protein|nr:hypothetical protein [Candidatus Saccharimonadales bacterium]
MKKSFPNIVRAVYGFIGIFFVAMIATEFLPVQLVSAYPAALIQRSLSVTSSANGTITTDMAGNPAAAGSGGNGAETGETFSFILPQTGNIGSIDFLYCTTPLAGTSCIAPTGLNASTVLAVQSQTGWTDTGGSPFVISSASTSDIKVSRTTPGDETNISTAVAISFGGLSTDYITNPTTDNSTFFVRITLYSDNAFSTPVDQGTVASSTATQVNITAKVQEELAFSVGTTVTSPAGNCSPFGDTGALTLGDSNGVLSPLITYSAHSYFRVSTNATHGLVIEYSGKTLANGTNNITAIGTTAANSTPGIPQFGLALDSSDTESGSGYSFAYLAPSSSPVNYSQGAGTITSGGTAYFAFDTSSVTNPKIISSSTGIIICDTGSVRYMANIAYATPAGIYTTTITYIAVPTY